MKKRGTMKKSRGTAPKKENHQELHKLAPKHLKKIVSHTKKTKLEHRIRAKKKELKREKIKELGLFGYFKHIHSLDFRPSSIKVLITYLIFLGLFNVLNLAFGVKAATFVLFGITLTGVLAFILHLMMIFFLLFVAYGIGRRERWGFDVAMAWFIIGIINSIMTTLFMKSAALEFVRQLTLISSISVIAINSLVIWYLIAQKKYFFDHLKRKASLGKEDKIFVYVILSFWIMVILIGITLGVRFFRDTSSKADSLVYELNGKSFWEAVDACHAKSGSEKDLCYVVVATMYNEGGVDICGRISSDFFRFTCRRAQA